MSEPLYPCQKCGKQRTKSEGGTIFTLCDECWNEYYGGKIMSKPLSKQFGFNYRPISTGSEYQETRNCGFNQALRELDQLSPDADKLAKIMYLYEINAKDCDWFLVHSGRKIELYKLAQEIINSMGVWIKKG